MSIERMMILEMLESGKITPADAQVLFQALGEEEPGDSNAIPDGEAPYPPETVLRSEMNQPAELRQPRPEPDKSTLTPAPAPQPAPVAHNHRRRYPDPSYAVAMKRTGLDFSIDQLFRMQEEDIDPELAIRMVRARRPEWTTEDIVEMLTKGACPDLVSKLNELGFGGLSPRDVIQLTEYDIDPEYLERFRGIQLTGLTARDLIEFYNNDVDPDLAIALKEIGLITTGDIVKAAEYDLSPSSVRQIAQVLPGITVRQLIELSDNDVSPDFIKALVRGGFTNLTIKQIINLQENDVDPNDAAWFRKKLGEHLALDDLLRLASHDISRDYVESLLKFNLPDLNVDTLIEMANHDVTAEDVALARKAYGDGFSVADLIEMVDNR
jgi:hypothetical protein